MEKVEQDQHISNHDIDKELNSFKSFGEGLIQKKFDVWVPHDLTMKNFMESNGILSNFHRIIVKTERNQTISETAHYGQ